MKVSTKPVTATEYLAQTPLGGKYQLIEGTITEMPSPTVTHQQVSSNLLFAFMFFLKKNNLGRVFCAPLDVILDNENVFQPDILFVSKERASIIQERIEGAPDLVVEVLSPSTAYYDIKQKKRIYAKYGVKEYWIIDPLEQTVECYEQQSGELSLKVIYKSGETLISDTLPNFSLPVSHIFID